MPVNSIALTVITLPIECMRGVWTIYREKDISPRYTAKFEVKGRCNTGLFSIAVNMSMAAIEVQNRVIPACDAYCEGVIEARDI